ncbi:MAG TPA: serine hydrolase domain-containing protein [Polyangiaceae bacterium]|nr:serine hydrolase domain-containing protein [Polyangiaceae bacterium]
MRKLRSTSWERLERLMEETEFSGVVLVELEQRTLHARAAGWADRARGLPNTLATQFANASGTKALTALAVLSLVADGTIELDVELPGVWAGASELLAAGVTLHQLLARTFGMGDDLDEDEIEAVTGRSYYEVVCERVCAPAGMHDTAFVRLEQLPARVGGALVHGRRVEWMLPGSARPLMARAWKLDAGAATPRGAIAAALRRRAQPAAGAPRPLRAPSLRETPAGTSQKRPLPTHRPSSPARADAARGHPPPRPARRENSWHRRCCAARPDAARGDELRRP